MLETVVALYSVTVAFVIAPGLCALQWRRQRASQIMIFTGSTCWPFLVLPTAEFKAWHISSHLQNSSILVIELESLSDMSSRWILLARLASLPSENSSLHAFFTVSAGSSDRLTYASPCFILQRIACCILAFLPCFSNYFMYPSNLFGLYRLCGFAKGPERFKTWLHQLRFSCLPLRSTPSMVRCEVLSQCNKKSVVLGVFTCLIRILTHFYYFASILTLPYLGEPPPLQCSKTRLSDFIIHLCLFFALPLWCSHSQTERLIYP